MNICSQIVFTHSNQINVIHILMTRKYIYHRDAVSTADRIYVVWGRASPCLGAEPSRADSEPASCSVPAIPLPTSATRASHVAVVCLKSKILFRISNSHIKLFYNGFIIEAIV